MNDLLNPTKSINVILFVMVLFILLSDRALAIIGGEEAMEGEQEWVVGIALADEPNGYFAQFCGGTLIHPEWILTAAHCTLDEDDIPFLSTDLDILVGRTILNSNDGQRVPVSKIIRHPGFELLTYNNDIALLRLSRPATSETISLVGAQSLFSSPITDFAKVYGWGTDDSGYGANALNKATLSIISQQDCETIYREFGILISNNMLCAGLAQGGIDSCVGDSGGPLIRYNNGKSVQVGIVSWGLECGAAGLYGVYTNVVNYNSWIYFQISSH
ncbi:MAG: serine protease [Chloroflexota bacterium]